MIKIDLRPKSDLVLKKKLLETRIGGCEGWYRERIQVKVKVTWSPHIQEPVSNSRKEPQRSLLATTAPVSRSYSQSQARTWPWEYFTKEDLQLCMRKKIHLQLSRKRWQKVRAGRKKLAKSVAAEKVARKRGKVGPIAGPRKRTNICTPPYHTPISSIQFPSVTSELWVQAYHTGDWWARRGSHRG